MCGIAGIVTSPNFELPDLQTRLGAMASAMWHRGPDDEGVYLSPDRRVGLANRRLAIRDLSPAGHMPMSNAAGTVWITYNGEIYNTDELRPQLERDGYHFRSTSDTEIILRGYEVWGMDVLARLEGMFAFAIYDCRERPQILFARDPLGIKPLYYAFTQNTLVFASELNTILASQLVSHAIDPVGLAGYLRMGSVPNPLTIYQSIAALEPASAFVFYPDRWTAPQPAAYWSLPTDLVSPPNAAQAAQEVEHLLAEAVRSRLVSDVPLGAFLSGGLDSSAIVGFMRQATTGTIRTCSMIFEEAAYSEAVYAKAMAQAVGAEHYERVITAADVLSEFDNILNAIDQPSIDGVNSYFVSQTARQAGLTVALSGLGGDELFGGYPNTFSGVPQMYRALHLAHAVPGGAALAGALVNRSGRRGWERINDALAYPPSFASAYLTRRGLFSASQVRSLLSPDVYAAAADTFDPVGHIASRADTRDANDSFSWVSRAELRTYMHHQLLRDTDVMSMAHSLEVRVPFLDRKLVETVLRLPAAFKTGTSGKPKPLLIQAIQQQVPALILNRTDKLGFTFPFDTWLRGDLRPRVEALVQASASSEFFRKDAISTLLGNFQAGKVHWSRLWAMVVVGSLLR